MNLTQQQLTSLYNRAPATRLNKYFEPLRSALTAAQINTPARLAAFLSQVGHESNELQYMAEVWGPTEQQLRYDPPNRLAVRLGNTEPGDGYRFRGAGPLQITGRGNFGRAGAQLHLDLINHPEMAFTASVGFELATWYWLEHGLNQTADKLTLEPIRDQEIFDVITRKINGGLTGKEGRDSFYARACKIFA